MRDPDKLTSESVSHSKTSPPCPFDKDQLERAFLPLLGSRSIQVHTVFSGNINTIVKVDAGGQHYGLRVRTQEKVYRYEPDLIKETFVLWLLNRASEILCDDQAAVAFSQIRAARRGTIEYRNEVLPAVRYYDWSRQHLSYPYCIYEWVEGVPLWDASEPRLYALAGQTLARIHRVQFSAFYADFLSIGKRPVNWNERYRAALSKEVAAARGRLRGTPIDQLVSLEIPSTVRCAPCLVHNDFAPGNILVRDGTIAAVIDWDNAVIDAPHLDFVKMKYWTAKNASGELAHAPILFSAFVDGYGPAGREIFRSPLLVLYEVLWLLRVFNFERSKEEQGLARALGYPAAAVYEEFLAEALDRLKRF